MQGDQGRTLFGERERLLRRGDYIWGSFLKPEAVDGYVVGVNPGDRSDVLGRFPFARDSLEDAVSCAQKGAASWRRMAIGERGQAVRRYREALSRNQDRCAILITRETGKPLWEARQEVLSAVRAVDLLLEDGVVLLEPRILDQREARSDYLPHGVVAVLGPYNQPLLTATLQCASALLAGNAVVFKPSKFTPAVGQAVAELMDRCRLPRGVFNMIQGSGSAVGKHLVAHPGVGAVLLSGTFQTAQAIRKVTVDRPELPMLVQSGGKGCALVLEDAELDRAVYEVLIGAFLTAGQRHNSTGRVIVSRELGAAFCEQLVRRARAVGVGYGFHPDTFFGPVISENFRNRYRRFGRRLTEEGHEALLQTGAREVEGRKGFYVDPAIYRVRWSEGKPFLDEPPPGPLLLVYEVESWEEGVELHNKLASRVSTSVFTQHDRPLLEEIGTRLETGALHVNRGTIGASLRLPSVGLGRASNGISSGIDLLRFLTTPRSTLVEGRPFEPSQMVPGVNWEAGELVAEGG